MNFKVLKPKIIQLANQDENIELLNLGKYYANNY